MGLEALSRGASEVIFVEESRRLARSIEQNLQRLGYEAKVICGDVRKVMPTLEPDRFDIIFADPPYRSRLGLTIVREVGRCGLLAPDGVLAVEHAQDADLPYQEAGLFLYDRREYGQTCVSFYRHRSPASQME